MSTAWRGLNRRLGARRRAGVRPGVDLVDPGGCTHLLNPEVHFDEDGRLGLSVMQASEMVLTKQQWFVVSSDEGTTWSEPIQLSHTGPEASWLDPRTWGPDAESTQSEAEWVVENPEDAGEVISGHQAQCCRRGVSNNHLISGGDYWDLSSTQDGFLVMWIDNHENGVPQLWTKLVEVAASG